MTSTATSTTLLEAIGIDALLPEEQEEMLLELNSLIFKGSLVRMIETMDEKTRDSFNGLIDTNPSDEEVESFLKKYVPGADQAVRDTVKELTDDILLITGTRSD